MELSQEDSLRLNVMLRQRLHAIRINESKMDVIGLSDKGEVKVSLNPTCADEKYLRWVRELLSTHVLGTPGGYPVYLKRWTRMGQMRDESLQGLLLLGEPEAVIAVAHAPGLTESIARHAWWIMPTAEVARKMLENIEVATSEFARELAAFLVEFLPFESDAGAIVDSVRLILQPGLITDQTRTSLWKKAGRKSAIYVGFLLATPDNLPDKHAAHAHYAGVQSAFGKDDEQDWYERQLLQSLSAPGQAFLATLEKTVAKLNSPDVAIALFKVLEQYFGNGQEDDVAQVRYIEDVRQRVRASLEQLNPVKIAAALPEADYREKLEAIFTLALFGEHLLNPIFAQTDAVGSVMRKKLQHVTDPLLHALAILQR